jgi:hypothetical protein
MSRVYRAFGISFLCNRPLDELLPSDSADFDPVIIRWGDVPPALAPPSEKRGLLELAKGELLLSIPGIARYHVTRAAITVAPEPGADDASVRLFLFGTPIGALLHLRGSFVLRASAVRLPDGGALAFCGATGCGKSTLAAALTQRGCSVMADDIVAISFDDHKQPWVRPGLAQLKLRKDVIDRLSLTHGNPVRPGVPKCFTDRPDCFRPEPLLRIYELSIGGTGPTTERKALSGIEVLDAIIRNKFRPAISSIAGSQNEELERAVALSNKVAAALMYRPRQRDTISETATLVCQDCEL